MVSVFTVTNMPLNGIQEVVGSIPSSSTNDYKGLEGFPSKPFFVEYINEIESWKSVLGEGELGMVSP